MMSGGENGWGWVVDCRPVLARRLDFLLRTLGFRSSIIGDLKAALRQRRTPPGPEIALVHLNFTEGGGGLFVTWFLKQIYPGIRVVMYTGDWGGPSWSLVEHLRIADALLRIEEVGLDRLTDLLPALAAAARADRAAWDALGPAGRASPHVAPRLVDLPQLHASLDRTAIRLALESQGSVRGAARALRMDPSTIRAKMRKLGIDLPDTDDDCQ